MGLSTQLANAGAVITLLLGVFGLLLPGRAARFVSVTPVGRVGTAELRATYGGLFIALGAAPLIAQDAGVFAVVGAAWMGAAAGRSLSYWYDGSREGRNLAAIAMELVVGWLLLAPMLADWWGRLLA